jgi:hypothetical protein
MAVPPSVATELVELRRAHRPVERLDARLPLIGDHQPPQVGPWPVTWIGTFLLL